jgi:hypothetical protein
VSEAEAGEVCEVKVAEVAGEVEIEPIRVGTKLDTPESTPEHFRNVFGTTNEY